MRKIGHRRQRRIRKIHASGNRGEGTFEPKRAAVYQQTGCADDENNGRAIEDCKRRFRSPCVPAAKRCRPDQIVRPVFPFTADQPRQSDRKQKRRQRRAIGADILLNKPPLLLCIIAHTVILVRNFRV